MSSRTTNTTSQSAVSSSSAAVSAATQKTTLTPVMVDKVMHQSQMDLSSHYPLGFASLGVFSSSNKNTNFNYGNTYNAYATDTNACSYLSSNYCTPNYNNFSALRYKSHGYPSI